MYEDLFHFVTKIAISKGSCPVRGMQRHISENICLEDDFEI